MGANPATGNEIIEPPKAGTASVTRVAASASSVQLLGANPLRLAGTAIVNESSATLSLKYGATASATSYTYQVPAGGTWEMPYAYVGRIDGIWSSATGNAQITELTP